MAAAAAVASSSVRSTVIVWFKSTDLRLHDHEPFWSAHTQAIKANQALLPVFIFDPRFLGAGRSSFGFAKSGPLRARFLVEAVTDLRDRLRARGSDLWIDVGEPEKILPQLACTHRVTGMIWLTRIKMRCLLFLPQLCANIDIVVESIPVLFIFSQFNSQKRCLVIVIYG